MESKEVVLEKYTRPGTYGYVFIENDLPVGAVRIAMKNNVCKVSALAVLPEYQNRGVALSLYIALFDECDRHGVTLIEAGTMMENNVKPNAAIKSAGGVLYKRYRLYGKKL